MHAMSTRTTARIMRSPLGLQRRWNAQVAKRLGHPDARLAIGAEEAAAVVRQRLLVDLEAEARPVRHFQPAALARDRLAEQRAVHFLGPSGRAVRVLELDLAGEAA